MRTSLPVSTISYNTTEFLKQALDAMLQQGEISFWVFIHHKGESGDKDHCHVYCEPSRLRTQDDWKKQYFLEFDPEHPTKPLSVTVWRKSNWKDWYLYGLHNKLYLMTKGERKQYEYSREDFVCSDDDVFTEYIADCDVPVGDSTFLAVKACVESGFTWAEAVASGIIPTKNLSGAREVFAVLTSADLQNNYHVDDDGYMVSCDPCDVAEAEGIFYGSTAL